MTKTKLGVPSDVPTLHRWLGQDPKAHLKELEGAIAKGATFERLAEPARIGLKWAWDEQPDVFFPLITPWLKGTNARLRRVAAGALPVSNPDQREKCVRLLKGLITDKDRDVRLTAIDLLAEDGGERDRDERGHGRRGGTRSGQQRPGRGGSPHPRAKMAGCRSRNGMPTVAPSGSSRRSPSASVG